MIRSLRVEEYQDGVKCKSSLYQSKESFLKCSFQLDQGEVYGVESDFGYGSWGLVTGLAGRGSDNHSGTIWIDGEKALNKELKQRACFISENIYPSINSVKDLLTPKQCIEKALSISGLPYSVFEIKDIFNLSKERFERSLTYVSGEIWLVSAAVNFSMGKDIFCYPWLNEFDIGWFEIACNLGIINFLQQQGKIILVPSSQGKILKKLCNHVLKFHNGKFIFK